MHPSFDLLRERLLRAGIAPRQVRRYVTELREHLADLTERERASGFDSRQAAERAMALLGSDAELAQAMIDRGPARSLAARAPWAVFVTSPLLLWVAVVGATDLAMFHLLSPVRAHTGAELPDGYRELIAVTAFAANYLLGALLAAFCVVVAARQRLASGWVWFGVGLIGVFSGLLGFHMHLTPAEGGHAAGMIFSAASIVYLDGRPNFGATIGVAMLHAVVLFAVAAWALHRWRSSKPALPAAASG